ncbi:hypothetical protein BGW36DRAFT_302412 [Talaromyces proteolyticus]|uniref:Uncharacterized protein n=1 Tax=Talaromyces proteolyticus TaxID=1131652 RepID=A0AAD4PXM3_9EURO|nr:uncharacterized protein BGW36DRAFT_302412 [Talaromyces proteolyticus]KAH8693286.1 hypothetical protein BGW36DRAFT_302412 [Talaromyces proteolyticus]
MPPFPSFASWDITPSTFSQLLKLYPTTLRESHKQRLLARDVRKHRKHPERLIQNNPTYAKQADALLELDSWRYNTLPQVLRDRAAQATDSSSNQNKNEVLKADEKYDGMFLHKEEAIKLLDWKLQRGRFRPQLPGMLKTNKPIVIRKASADAFKALVDKQPSLDAIDETYPKDSLDMLTGPIRAVGPALASLILALATEGKANEIPFYSDELFLWLCVDSFPISEKNRRNYEKATRLIRKDGSGLNLKYNMHEYRQLYEEVVKFRQRLNGEVREADETARLFTTADVERVAYVIQHLGVSGFPDAAEILRLDEESKKATREEAEGDDEAEEMILGVTTSKPSKPGKRKGDWNQKGKTKKKKI